MTDEDQATRAADYVEFVDIEWSAGDDVVWDEGDGEADLEAPSVDIFAFSGALEIDDSSHERWLQSCLQGLVAPGLVVDGAPGAKTREAIRAFQRRIRALRPGARALSVDGIAGPTTLAALELCTNSTRPARSEAERRAAAKPAPSTAQTGAYTVTTQQEGEHVRHIVAAYGDRVSFHYTTRERTGIDGKALRDAFNVMAYEGARRDLLTDEILRRRGLAQPEIDILRENAFKESRGAFGAVNTWDDQIVSWGMAQFAGHAGSLAGLLIFLKEHAPVAFARYFLAAGIDVDYGPYPYFDRKQRRASTRTGAHVKLSADDKTYVGDHGWSYLRTQPRLIGALMLAGNDVEIQLGQCLFWKDKFLDRAVATRIGEHSIHRVLRAHGSGTSRKETTLLAGAASAAEWRAWADQPANLVEGKNLADLLAAASAARYVHHTRDGDRVIVQVETTPGRALRSYCTSTYSLGVMARLYNWMPAHLRAWSQDFLTELAAARPGVDILDPDVWTREPTLELEFIAKVKTRRREVKKGSYDPPYGDSLSKQRGSFESGEVVRAVTEEPDGALDEREPVAATPVVVAPTAELLVGAPEAAVASPDVDVCAMSPVDKRKRVRAWSEIKGITLHQTGVHGFGARAWPKVTSHLGVHSDGRVYLIHPLQAYLWSSDALNRDTVAIEVAGNFIGDPERPGSSYWKPGGGPSTLTDVMIDGLRRAIRWIVAEVARHGGRIDDIYAHRQAKRGKSVCPGAAIWLHAGVWAQEELGLGNGGPGYTRSDGQPIPPAWDPRLLAGPLPFFDADDYGIDAEMMSAEVGAEFPDEGEDPFAEARPIVASAVRVRALPPGLRLVEASGAAQFTSRGSLDLSAPIDLDALDEAAAAEPLDEMLARQGLFAVDVLELRADGGPTTRGLGGLHGVDLDGHPGVDDVLDFELAVEEDERAVVLLESDGMLSWRFPEADEAPEAGPRTRASGGSVARFRVPLPAADGEAADGPGPTRGLLGSVIGGTIRARVYKFVAGVIMRLTVPAAIAHLERGQREGLVVVRGEALRDWVDRDDLRELGLPSGGAARVLLLVHGTFSSTRGSFGGLCTEQGPEALRRMLAGYDAVIGVDHRTLSRWPRENAEAIRDLLLAHPWPEPPHIDVLCFSRGGLVARELIEHVLPAAGWRGPIGRVICVATTNAGAELARPRNWHDMIDIYTTVACAAIRGLGALGGGLAGLLGGEVVTAVGALVQALATHAVEQAAVPGLAAMDPDGEVIAALNRAPLPAGPPARYYAISSCFDASMPGSAAGLTAYAKKAILARISGRLSHGLASDLVVHNGSTHALHPGLVYSERHHFAANPSVYHVNFFFQPEVHAKLVTWLELGALPATAPPPAFVTPTLVRRGFDENGPLTFGDDTSLVDLHLRAEAPARVGLETTFEVRVELSREALDQAAGSNAALASALVEHDELVTVEVVPRARVSPVAHAPVAVTVPPPGAVTGLFFRVLAEELGEGELWVVVRQHGRPLARLVLHVQVTAGPGVGVELVRATAASEDTETSGREAVLEVIELREAGGLRYRYHLRAPALGLHHRYESGLVPAGRDDYVRGLFDRIERDWKQANGDPRAFDRRLRALGVQLGEQLLPRELMVQLWDRRDQLHGLQLLSDEGHIPWELVHLKHPDRPLAAGDHAFLGELGLVRALWGVALPQRIRVRRGHVFTVVPEYPTPALALPSAQIERAWLAQHVGALPLDARPDSIEARLAAPGSFDVMHFACHGEVADYDAWLLLQGEVREVQEGGVARRKWFPGRLGAAEVAASGDLRGPGGRRPLVFLNACKVARAEHLLTGFSGWAPALLRTGAGAVVAPLWSVGDGSALRFAEGFYGALLQEASFAEATVAAREHARALGDPTWLAYAVYAAPDGRLHVERAPGEGRPGAAD